MAKHMRVLQVNKFYDPHVGGVETVVRQLAEGLSEQGEETRVLTCHHDVHPSSTQESIGAVDVTRAGSLAVGLNASLSPAFLSRYRREVRWADVVHFHVPSPTPELAHRLFGVPSGTSVVATVHADPGGARWGELASLYSRVLITPLLRRADAIVGTAPKNVDNSRLLTRFQEKCTVIPLATDFSVRSTTGAERRRHKEQVLSVSPDESVILFVGRLARYKGLRYLVESMDDVNATLFVVGAGNKRATLEREVKERDLQDRIHFEGYVPDERLSTYYRAADIFVLPSVAPAEAFGIVQLDAMAHGIPVVNTSLPTGVPFVSQHEETGLTVPPRDAEALAAALRQLIDKEGLREQCGKKAAERAKKFTTGKMVERHLSLYRKCSQ